MSFKPLTLLCGAISVIAATTSLSHAQPSPKPSAVPQAEVSDVATMPSMTTKWIYITANWDKTGVGIFDGETGKMKGMLEVPSLGNLGFDPKGQYYYIAETYWSKGSRGVRQDMVSIYDAQHLKLQAEVPVPGHLLGGTVLNNFVVSSDGKRGFVYTLAPSSAVEVVDLEKRKFDQTVQLPGCAALFASGAGGVSALCADGSMATVAFNGGKAAVTHSASFFPAKDPVFDTVVVDRTKNVATFMSYTGKIYTATLGANPQFSAPWSIQAAAGMKEPVPAPVDVNWLPGGAQPLAINRVTGRIYVLMHIGEQFSHKEPGQEIWVLDGATHKVIGRHATPGKVQNIQVSQEAKPLIYVNGAEDKAWVLDEETFESKQTISKVGDGSLYVIEPS